ncbi:MAG: glycoside hydrolase, partial [Spirochaetaceae bacterium]|nr:glycoside hydrolase [Spirochaetaceae bacterium]
SDEALPLIALMRAVETGALGKALADEARDTISAALKAERKRALEVSNPFLHPRRLVRVPGRDERGQFFYPHDNPSDYWWQGENSRLASWAAAFRRYGGGKENGEFADAQISWIFGLNPFDACMLKGSGRNNPDYEWDQFNLPGGVSNGITSGFDDENDIDFMPEGPAQDGIHSWRWAEQWIPHAAWLLLAVVWGVPLIREEIS